MSIKVRRYLLVVGFLGTIFGANWALERFGVLMVGGLAVPSGVLFAGLAFVLRDLLHDEYGKLAVVGLIVAGALISGLLSPIFALASGMAFLFGEFADLTVYAPLRERHRYWGIVASGIVGAVIDSVIFLTLAFGSLAFLPGQVIGKVAMVALAFVVVRAGDAVFSRGTSRALAR